MSPQRPFHLQPSSDSNIRRLVIHLVDGLRIEPTAAFDLQTLDKSGRKMTLYSEIETEL